MDSGAVPTAVLGERFPEVLCLNYSPNSSNAMWPVLRQDSKYTLLMNVSDINITQLFFTTNTRVLGGAGHRSQRQRLALVGRGQGGPMNPAMG